MRPIAGSYQDMFTTLLSGRPEIELVPYDLLEGEYPEHPSECDGWISTGSKWSVTDDEPWIHWLEEFVRQLHDAKAPHVGVCFGSQMIAHALEGEVTIQAAGWGVGVADTKVIEQAEWMVPHQDSFRAVISYQDQITKLPPDSKVIAATEHCPVSMFTLGRHSLGIGGHPEIPLAYIRALIESRRGIRIPEATADAGLASTETTPDALLLRDWMTEFLLRAAR
jgi:GMP synthase-like glutamine amidotransferase